MKICIRKIAIPCLFFALGAANRGMIPGNPNAQIFEPNQRAMIAWNGAEEILLLSTDLHASESTMVVEVLPLPSEPEVKKGDLATFRKATDLINRKLYAGSIGKGRDLSAGVILPSGEVTFHQRIGAHDISVAHLLDAQGFVDWVIEYLAKQGVEENVISSEMKELIEDYIGDGYDWFVFDVVSLSQEIVTNEPIQYRFKTKRMFFPLKITRTGKGMTSVELLILTARLLNRFPGLPIGGISLKHDPITITREELRELNSDMFEIMRDHEKMRLRIWQIEGSLSSFDSDLIAY